MAKEKNLTNVTSIAAADFARLVTSAGASVKATAANLAKYVIETYNGSSVAGSSQSVKDALDSLNSKNLQNPQILTSSNDMNTLTTPGVYYTQNTDMPTNAPVQDAYNSAIIVIKARSIDVLQFYFCNNKGILYYRSQFGSSWRAWQKIQLVSI